MIYGVDIGARRIAIAGPDYLLAALKLPDPVGRGRYRWTAKSEVNLLAGFLAAVVPPEGTIWVEQAVVKHGKAANIGTAIRLGMTAGALFGVHAGPGYVLDQAIWKAAICGSGHATKEDIAGYLASDHPDVFDACAGDQDLADASCIRLYGELVAAGELEGPWAV